MVSRNEIRGEARDYRRSRDEDSNGIKIVISLAQVDLNAVSRCAKYSGSAPQARIVLPVTRPSYARLLYSFLHDI